ncbi:MAG: DMT family transporter [Ferroplasma sp.]
MASGKNIILFSIMIIFWALNYSLIKIALNFTSPSVLLFYRILFSAIAIFIIFRKKIHLHISRKEIMPLFILSMLNVLIWMELWFLAESTISASLASILIYTYPIISTLFAVVLLKEKHNSYVFAGIAIGFAGIIVIFSKSIISGLKIGDVLALLGAVIWSFGTIYYMKYHINRDRETTNFFQFTFAIIPALVIGGIADPKITIFEPSLYLIALILIISIPGTAIAYFAFLQLNRQYGVSTVSSFLFLVPALSVVFGIIILNEIPSIYEIIGFILVAIGIVFSARGTNMKKKQAGNKLIQSKSRP